jgi:phage terminase small subunit
MPGPLRNTRHEAFAQELFKGIAEGRSQAASYSAAGYTNNPNAAAADACRLLKASRHIIARVQELQEQTARKKKVTVETVVDELDTARAIAERNEQASAMVQATSVKAKVCGLFVEKTEVGKPGDFLAGVRSMADLAERLLLETNPDAIITDEMRQQALLEFKRHWATINAIAKNQANKAPC